MVLGDFEVVKRSSNLARHTSTERGLYINPQLHGQPDSKGLGWDRRQKAQRTRDSLRNHPGAPREGFKADVTFPTGSLTPATGPKPA